jgi:phage terminase Nu1 subunit (DNA packaging protein)
MEPEQTRPLRGGLIGLPRGSFSERYVDRKELAAMLGVSASTVDRMRVAGMPSVTYGRRLRRFKPSVCLAWIHAREDGAPPEDLRVLDGNRTEAESAAPERRIVADATNDVADDRRQEDGDDWGPEAA